MDNLPKDPYSFLQDNVVWCRNHKPVIEWYVPKVHISALRGYRRYRLKMRNNYKDYKTCVAILNYLKVDNSSKGLNVVNRFRHTKSRLKVGKKSKCREYYLPVDCSDTGENACYVTVYSRRTFMLLYRIVRWDYRKHFGSFRFL